MSSPARTRTGPDLSISFCGINFKNPIIAASGTFGYGVEFEDIVALDKLGGFVVNAREDYEAVIRTLNEGEHIAAYELNVSCPNMKQGGINFGSDVHALEEVVSACKRLARRPLIVKLSPNVTSIPVMARVAEEAGADALSLVNTFVALAIDPVARKPRISNITAGLSGPAIKPIALRMVYEAARAVNIPVIGMGGIATGSDAVEFLLAGAAAVQVGTASYFDPCATEHIVDQLYGWCIEHRVRDVKELIGGLKVE
jgi:dihydroorotate dehydrogenase (NAD+) catalytic subunit